MERHETSGLLWNLVAFRGLLLDDSTVLHGRTSGDRSISDKSEPQTGAALGYIALTDTWLSHLQKGKEVSYVVECAPPPATSKNLL